MQDRKKYRYAGFHDPIQKITGDSYRALYGIKFNYKQSTARTYSGPNESSVLKVYKAVKIMANNSSLRLSDIADTACLSKTTTVSSMRVLEDREWVKITRRPNLRTKGWIYEYIPRNNVTKGYG